MVGTSSKTSPPRLLATHKKKTYLLTWYLVHSRTHYETQSNIQPPHHPQASFTTCPRWPEEWEWRLTGCVMWGWGCMVSAVCVDTSRPKLSSSRSSLSLWFPILGPELLLCRFLASKSFPKSFQIFQQIFIFYSADRDDDDGGEAFHDIPSSTLIYTL